MANASNINKAEKHNRKVLVMYSLAIPMASNDSMPLNNENDKFSACNTFCTFDIQDALMKYMYIQSAMAVITVTREKQ